MAKKKGNNYIIDKENNLVRIELQRRNFPYTWYARFSPNNQCYYVFATVHVGVIDGKQKNKIVALHQFVLDTDKFVDHIEHDTLDNRKSKLRIIDNKHNLRNRKGRNNNNKSGYRNVSWSNGEQKWIVQLQVDGKNTCLGKFPKDQLEEAGKFAEEMRKKYYGEFAGVS